MSSSVRRREGEGSDRSRDGDVPARCGATPVAIANGWPAELGTHDDPHHVFGQWIGSGAAISVPICTSCSARRLLPSSLRRWRRRRSGESLAHAFVQLGLVLVKAPETHCLHASRRWRTAKHRVARDLSRVRSASASCGGSISSNSLASARSKHLIWPNRTQTSGRRATCARPAAPRLSRSRSCSSNVHALRIVPSVSQARPSAAFQAVGRISKCVAAVELDRRQNRTPRQVASAKFRVSAIFDLRASLRRFPVHPDKLAAW